MFTTAEQRAIDQLSTESGRLAVVAAEQRTKLVEALQAAGLESRMDFMRAYKLDLVSALAPAAPAMLLDPEIALPHVTDAGALPAQRPAQRRAAAGGGRRRRAPAGRHRGEAAAAAAGRSRGCRRRERGGAAGGGRGLRGAPPVAGGGGAGLPAGRRGRGRIRGSAGRPDPGGGAAGRVVRRSLPEARIPGGRSGVPAGDRRAVGALGAALGRRRPRDVHGAAV